MCDEELYIESTIFKLFKDCKSIFNKKVIPRKMALAAVAAQKCYKNLRSKFFQLGQQFIHLCLRSDNSNSGCLKTRSWRERAGKNLVSPSVWHIG